MVEGRRRLGVELLGAVGVVASLDAAVLDLRESVEVAGAGGLHLRCLEDDVVEVAEAAVEGEIERRRSRWPGWHDEALPGGSSLCRAARRLRVMESCV